MATSLTSAPQFNTGDTFGVFLVAVVIASCLYGVACLQTWYYFRNYNDCLLLRVTVLAVLILETVHEIVTIHAVYHYLILNFGKPFALVDVVWSVTTVIPVTDVLSAIAHLFYAAQIYRLSNKKGWWISAMICFLMIVQIVVVLAGFCIYFTINVAQVANFVLLSEDKQLLMLYTNGLSWNATQDVICALTISYYLHTSRSGIRSTDTLINKLIAHAVNNGALTSAAGICVICFLVPKPKGLIYLAIFLIGGNLYSNSLLSMLNSRRSHTQATLPITVDTLNPSFAIVGNLDTSGSMHTTDNHSMNIIQPSVQSK
ncbi:hypothetical protein Moror_9326 [Moniliophthora roreri MCA 2997]|uniref:DUF6534 domain-containing protein n=1 Tax=Moniliophthora roreri (strain MCA 2997) TaxID=1381753 RepID=V2WX31_MONRO|nr:hypothetical protein Moror_9326 [Moniliophthora roreri MCA 2997]